MQTQGTLYYINCPYQVSIREHSMRILRNQLRNSFQKKMKLLKLSELNRKIFTRQELTTIDNSKSREQVSNQGQERENRKHFNQGNFKTFKQQMVANTFLKCKHPLKFNKYSKKHTCTKLRRYEAEDPAQAVTRTRMRKHGLCTFTMQEHDGRMVLVSKPVERLSSRGRFSIKRLVKHCSEVLIYS